MTRVPEVVPVNADRLALIEEIFHAVLEHSPEDRPAFLVAACRGDDEIFNEVDSLLPFSGAVSNLIDTPPIDIAADLIYEQDELDIVGRTVDHYRILSKLGSGGMGDVFLADDLRLERKVAIKFIRSEFAEHKPQVRRFLREARMASSLNHPNIITVHEIGTADGLQFIATEFIDGITLRRALLDRKLSLGNILDISVQAATALNAAHTAGILHRDIKPENIMLRSDGLVKVLDFGLAKLAKSPAASAAHTRKENTGAIGTKIADTSPGLVMGTAGYMSPEQAQVRPADPRTDVWSLGVVMFEMFAGQKPFVGATSSEMIASILRDDPPPLGENTPVELSRVIHKALAKEPDHRFQNAGELLSALRAYPTELIQHDPAGVSKIGEAAGANRSLTASASRGTNAALFDSGLMSRPAYIINGVRQHKVVSGVALALLVAVIGISGYFARAGYSQPITSIAVLPFVNETGDPGKDYLSDGITESLIYGLSRMHGFTVIARSTAFDYKGKPIDIRQVADELGVQSILTGRVDQRGDSLYVSAELTNVSDRSQIWGAQFNHRSSDAQQVPNEILRHIVAQLGLRLSTGERTQIEARRDIDPRAYELFLKGSFYRSIASEAGANKAVELYQQAIAVDPNYAEAYAALARVYLYLGANGFRDPKETAAKAETAARRALELDDSNPEVHLAMAGIKKIAFDWSGADLEFKRAIALNPNLAAVRFTYSFFLVTQGRYEEAIVEAKRSRELDPLRTNVNLDTGFIYYFARQYDLALEQYNTGVELRPDYGPAYYGRGLTYAASGRHDEALADYREMQRLSGGELTGLSCYIGVSLVKTGRLDEAKAVLKALESGKEYVSPVELAILYTALGKREKALASLEAAYAERDPQMQYLAVEPHLDDLRSEPRFARLSQMVGMGFGVE